MIDPTRLVCPLGPHKSDGILHVFIESVGIGMRPLEE